MRAVVWLASLLGVSAVTVAGAQPAPGAIVQRVIRVNPARPVSFDAAVSPSAVFVGEQITYEMGIYISVDAMQRMRRNPEVIPAPLRGVLAFDLGTARTLPVVQINGVRVVPNVLARALFPLSPGTLSIPASTMTYAIPRTTSYFSREESATLSTRPLRVTVKPLPESGRPAAFTGAVGDLSLRIALPSGAARIGEPVTVTVQVSGRGNAKLWPRPTLVVDTSATVAPVLSTERVRVDSSSRVISGTHEFEWIVTPTRAGALTLTVEPYTYFDPKTAGYETATAPTAQLTVSNQGSVVVSGSGAEVDASSRDLADYVTLRQKTPWWRRVGAEVVTALLVVVLTTYVVVRRRRHSPSPDVLTRDTKGALHALLHTSFSSADTAASTSATASMLRTLCTLLDARLEELVGDTTRRPLAVADHEQGRTMSTAGADTAHLAAALRRAGVARDTTDRLLEARARLNRTVWGGTRHELPQALVAEVRDCVQRLEAELLPDA